MKYIITGSSGHIGNNFVRLLLKKEPDAQIIALNRRMVTTELQGINVTQVIGNLLDNSFLEKHITSEAIVIHLAAFIDMKNNDYQRCYEINYLMTKKLCDVCLQKGVQKFIYVGSVDGIYKNKKGLIAEPDEYFPEKMQGNYAITKAMGMKYVNDCIKNNRDFKANIVLPSAVLGINDYKPSSIGKVFLRVLKGKSEVGLVGGYNFVDVEDVCEGMYKLSQSNLTGQYIFSGSNVTVKEVYNMINQIKGYRRHPIILPIWLAYIASVFVPILNKITIHALLDEHNYSSLKANNDLGYKNTDIYDTFKHTIDWFENNQKLFK